MYETNVIKILMPESKSLFCCITFLYSSCGFWKRLLRSLFLMIRGLQEVTQLIDCLKVSILSYRGIESIWVHSVHAQYNSISGHLPQKCFWLAGAKSLNTPSKHHFINGINSYKWWLVMGLRFKIFPQEEFVSMLDMFWLYNLDFPEDTHLSG